MKPTKKNNLKVCPRCRNRGFYLDNDAEGFKGRTNKVRCGCPAGDPELDA